MTEKTIDFASELKRLIPELTDDDIQRYQSPMIIPRTRKKELERLGSLESILTLQQKKEEFPKLPSLDKLKKQDPDRTTIISIMNPGYQEALQNAYQKQLEFKSGLIGYLRLSYGILLNSSAIYNNGQIKNIDSANTEQYIVGLMRQVLKLPFDHSEFARQLRDCGSGKESRIRFGLEQMLQIFERSLEKIPEHFKSSVRKDAISKLPPYSVVNHERKIITKMLSDDAFLEERIVYERLKIKFSRIKKLQTVDENLAYAYMHFAPLKTPITRRGEYFGPLRDFKNYDWEADQQMYEAIVANFDVSKKEKQATQTAYAIPKPITHRSPRMNYAPLQNAIMNGSRRFSDEERLRVQYFIEDLSVIDVLDHEQVTQLTASFTSFNLHRKQRDNKLDIHEFYDFFSDVTLHVKDGYVCDKHMLERTYEGAKRKTTPSHV